MSSRISNNPRTSSMDARSQVGSDSQIQQQRSDNRAHLQTGFETNRAQMNMRPAAPSIGRNLQHCVAGGEILKRGSKGVEVAEMQQILNRAGVQPPLEVDGKFGPKTDAALRQFQQRTNIKVDGKFGPESFGSVRQATGLTPGGMAQPSAPISQTAPNAQATPTGPANGGPILENPNGQPTASAASTAPAPAAGPSNSDFVTGNNRVSTGFANNRAGRQQQAEDLLKANGMWPPEDGRAYAIQIDQDAPPSSASRSDRRGFVRSYTGQTAVFRAENGRLVEQGSPMRSASHPGQFATNSSGTPDINRDGRKDIAHIRPGVYRYHARATGSGRYNPVDNGEFRVARDSNQDGVIDGSEASGNHSASGIQIHVGRSDGPSSVGCQTMPPQDYQRFRQAIRDANYGGNGQFTYILARRPNDRFGANPY